MSQPGSRNNRVRALSVRPVTPPPPLPEEVGATEDRVPRDQPRLPRSRTARTRAISVAANPAAGAVPLGGGPSADDGRINEKPEVLVAATAPLQGAGESAEGVVVAEVEFDEIDEATGHNIVVEAPIPREEAELVFGKISAAESEALAADDLNPPPIDANLLANYSMVSRSRTWKEWMVFMVPGLMVVGFTFLSATSRTLFFNQLPFIMSDYFGSSQRAAMVQTTADATRAAAAMLAVPIYGSLLDTIGRRPFFIITAVLNTLPTTFLLAFPSSPILPLLFYEVSQLLSTTYYLAFITDMYSDGRDRSKVMAIVTGVTTASSLIGIFGALVSPTTSIWVAWAIMLVRVPYACFFPESLDPAQRKDFSWKLININPMPAIRSISGNRVLVGVTFIVASLLIAGIGAGELMPYYLQIRVNWSESDAYYSGIESGLVGPFMLLVIYPFLSKMVRPSRIVLLSYFCVLISALSLVLLFQKWEAFAITFVFINTINIGVPPLLGIFTTAGEGNDQGRRLAGILAVMDLMNAVVPLAVGQLFSHIPENLSWVTFAICFVAALPGFVTCALLLPKWIANDRKQTLSKSLAGAPSGYSAH